MVPGIQCIRAECNVHCIFWCCVCVCVFKKIDHHLNARKWFVYFCRFSLFGSFNSIIRWRVLSKCFLIYLPCAVLYFIRFFFMCHASNTFSNSLWRVDFSSFFAIAGLSCFFFRKTIRRCTPCKDMFLTFLLFHTGIHFIRFVIHLLFCIRIQMLHNSRYNDGKINYLVYVQIEYTQDTKWNGTHQIYRLFAYKIFITNHYRISSSLNLRSTYLLYFAFVFAWLFSRLFVIIFLWFIIWRVFLRKFFHSLKICVWNTCTIYSYNLIPPLV